MDVTMDVIVTIFNVVLSLVILAVGIFLFVLIVKALKKYINSKPVREEKKAVAKSLGDVLKMHRAECKMTQEFVAESIGVSRQAVSKWESGASDPSTANLLGLADLFGIAAEDLLKEASAPVSK